MSDEQASNCREYGPLQFTTRMLLMGTAVCALWLVFVQFAGAMWGCLVLWFLVLIAGHVAGNLHGAHNAPPAREGMQQDAALSGPPVPPVVCAPATRLRDSKGFGRVRALLTISAALLGGGAGTAALYFLLPADVGGMLLGGVSSGILCGFLGFVAGSFVMVATRAFREAADEARSLPLRGAKTAA